MKRIPLKNSLMLLLAACIWGFSFVAAAVAGETIECFTYNFVRNIIGGLVLIPVIYVLDQKKKKELGEEEFEKQKGEPKTLLLGGTCCGLILFLAENFQQYGVPYTTVGKAGFITALYIVLVPIMGIFVKKKIGKKVWLGVVLATIGLYLLCMTKESLTISKGDFFILICSIFFTFHILVIDHFSPMVDGVRMSCMQFLLCGILSGVFAFIFENPNMSAIIANALPILYAGVLSSGVAYTLQIVYQKNMEPAVASLILSLESVFSVLGGWLILNQTLSLREFAGCVLMFLAIILAQLPEKAKSL